MSQTLPRLLRGALLFAAAGLAGCASISNLWKDEPPPASTAAGSAADGAAVRLVAEYELVVEAPSALRDLLQEHLDLARFRSAPEDQRLSRQELGRLIQAAPQQAQALLETEGFFNALVQVSRNEGSPVVVTVKVEPGPQTRVKALQIEFAGALAPDQPQVAGADLAALRERLQGQWSLGLGQDFSQPRWSQAKNELLATARARGFPLATLDTHSARIDAETQSAELDLKLDSGPLFRLGELQIEGLKYQPRSSVERLAGFSIGQPYTEQLLLDFQERLVRTTLFDSVNVDIQPLSDPPEAAPVHIKLREAPRQQLTASIGYDTGSGPRLGADYIHRRPFGLDLRARSKLKLSQKNSSYDLELSSHPQPDMQRNVGALFLERKVDDNKTTVNLRARVGRTRETERQDRTYYLELLRARETDPQGTISAGAASANVQWIHRRLDSPLTPTRGYSASLLLGVGRADSSEARNGGFLRSHLRLQAYQPLPGGWFGSARSEWGQVFASQEVGLPEKLRFRTGGDDTVRGYGLNDLGPRDADGNATGGRILWNGSVELAHGLTASMPALLGAVFVDAGQAAQHWHELKPSIGYGFGMRYRSPLGTLRLDLARGQETQKWRMHFSVGIAL